MSKPKANTMRDPGYTAMIPPHLDFTQQDWEEIYYALDTKARLIRKGDYGGSAEDDGVGIDEWASHLELLMRKIGGHAFSDDNTYFYAFGGGQHRSCRTCYRNRKRKYREEKKGIS